MLKLLHLSGKAGLAEDLWQQMAVLGVQGLIGCLVMMDVWQARSAVGQRLMLKFVPKELRSFEEMQSI